MPAKPGQPTKYRKDFHNADFIRLSKQGKNITQIALEWDIDRETIYNWTKAHKEFFGTVKRGKAFAEGWYINLGQLAMIGEASVNGRKVKIDVGMYVWLTKNIFKWSDNKNQGKPANTDDPCAEYSDDELDDL